MTEPAANDRSPTIWTIVGAVLLVLLWEMLSMLPILAGWPARWALLWTVGVFAAYALGVFGRGSPSERQERFRLNRIVAIPGRAWPPVIAAAILVVAGVLMLVVAHISLFGKPPDIPDGPLERYAKTPNGLLLIGINGALFAPLVEEVNFRGAIQGILERDSARWIAVTTTAVLFALIHFKPDYLPEMLFAGFTMGTLAAVTGSIWPGFLTHVLWNATLFGLDGLNGDAELATASVPGAWVGVAMIGGWMICTLLFWLLCRQLEEQRLRGAAG